MRAGGPGWRKKRSQDAPGRHLGPLGPLVGGMADKRDDHHAEQGKENKRHDNGNELQVVGRGHLVEGESELGENRTAEGDQKALGVAFTAAYKRDDQDIGPRASHSRGEKRRSSHKRRRGGICSENESHRDSEQRTNAKNQVTAEQMGQNTVSGEGQNGSRRHRSDSESQTPLSSGGSHGRTVGVVLAVT